MDEQNIIEIQLGKLRNTCFVVMPFDPLFQTQYERVIKPSIESIGIECIRGDEIYARPDIMSDIWKSIRAARFILAELTGRNPNVFYEIGLAHAIGKPIILLTRNQEDVPFDLQALRYRYYDVNDPFWGDNLSDAIKSMVRAILEEQQVKPYLEGIGARIHFLPAPTAPVHKPIPKTPLVNVVGTWKGEWMRSNGTISHCGTMSINQKETQLIAHMTVTFEKNDDHTIVQEILTGSLIDGGIILNGISYTYVNQGASTSYLMDNFELEISEDGQLLQGKFKSKLGVGKASFKRIE